MSEQQKLEPPSNEFASAVCDGGTPVADCQLCGRTHFATGDKGISWEPGELERLRAKAAEDPDKYRETSDDSVGMGWIDGRQVVWGCPCNNLRRYEDFVWRHRYLILRYIRDRNKLEQGDADRDRKMFLAALGG